MMRHVSLSISMIVFMGLVALMPVPTVSQEMSVSGVGKPDLCNMNLDGKHFFGSCVEPWCKHCSGVCKSYCGLHEDVGDGRCPPGCQCCEEHDHCSGNCGNNMGYCSTVERCKSKKEVGPNLECKEGCICCDANKEN